MHTEARGVATRSARRTRAAIDRRCKLDVVLCCVTEDARSIMHIHVDPFTTYPDRVIEHPYLKRQLSFSDCSTD